MSIASLKTKMSLAVSLLITVVILLLALLAFWYFERQFKDTIATQQFTLVSALAAEIDSKILNAQQELVAVAGAATANLAGDTRLAQNFLDAQAGLRTVFNSGIIIFSPTGTLIAASPAEPHLQGRDYAFRDYIRQTVATGRPQISAPFFSTQQHRHPIIMFTAPYFDAGGNMTGILAGAVDLLRDNFLGKLATIKIGEQGYLYLYSTDRTIIVHHDRTRILSRDVPPGVNKLFDRAIQGFEGTGDTVNSRGLHAVSSFKRLKSTNWILASNFPQAEVYAPIKNAKLSLLAVMIVVLLLLIPTVWWFMRYLTAPLLLFTQHVKGSAGKGEEMNPVLIASRDEIGTLADAFNEMLAERRRAGAELEFKNIILTTQQETSIDGILVVSEDGTIISYNRRFVDLWAIPPELVAAKDDAPVLQLVATRVADPESFVARVKYLYNCKDEKSREEILLKDGRVFDRYSAPMLGADGKNFGRVWYFREITERKRMEETLRESEQSYRSLVELSPDAIYIHTDGLLVFSTVMGAKLLGAERPEQLYGRQTFDFVHPDYREIVRKRIALARQHKTSSPLIEELFVRLDGSIVPVDVTSISFDYQGKESVLVVARDIRERKKMQDELLKIQKLESLGVLAGGIAHDFNNILTGILGSLSISRLQLESSHKIARHLEQCEKAAIQAGELARQLLTFSRGGEPVKKLIEMANLIREAAAFVLSGSNVRSSIEIADDLWCTEADEGQLSQVLHNLLLNAVQAMPEGGELGVRAENEALGRDNPCQLPSGEYLRLAVEDRGNGIPQENLGRIFDPYFTTKPQGSGMGLASVYSIVKRHGGTVEVSSTLGSGTRFVIHLPASPGKQPAGAGIKEISELAGKGRVLVMDDEEIIREIATEILQYVGYVVESCADGQQAIERYRTAQNSNTPFSAVILDLTVPGGMGGKEAASLILETDPKAVLIVSSGYSNDPVVADYCRYGFSGSIPKPFGASTMARELARLIPMPVIRGA
jgi:two-component system, cell cycle sensor histidine kinase and response regulator CckA